MALCCARSRARFGICALAFAVGLATQGSAPARSAVRDEAQAVLSDASARQFLLETIEEKVHGEWGKAWTSLYPFHKRIAPRGTYVRCETRTPFPAPLESLRVAELRRATVRVPGLPRTVAGVALTVVVKLRWYGPRDPIVFRHTFHLVPVRGRWTWLLSPSRFWLYKRHGCGADEVMRRRSAARSETHHPDHREACDAPVRD